MHSCRSYSFFNHVNMQYLVYTLLPFTCGSFCQQITPQCNFSEFFTDFVRCRHCLRMFVGTMISRNAKLFNYVTCDHSFQCFLETHPWLISHQCCIEIVFVLEMSEGKLGLSYCKSIIKLQQEIKKNMNTVYWQTTDSVKCAPLCIYCSFKKMASVACLKIKGCSQSRFQTSFVLLQLRALTLFIWILRAADANSRQATAAIELCQYSSILSIISMNRAYIRDCIRWI